MLDLFIYLATVHHTTSDINILSPLLVIKTSTSPKKYLIARHNDMFWQFPVHSWYWYYWFVSSTSHKYIILTFPLYSWRWYYEYISTTRYTDIILTFPVYSWCWYYEYISSTRLCDIYWYFPSLVIWTFPVVDLTS